MVKLVKSVLMWLIHVATSPWQDDFTVSIIYNIWYNKTINGIFAFYKYIFLCVGQVTFISLTYCVYKHSRNKTGWDKKKSCSHAKAKRKILLLLCYVSDYALCWSALRIREDDQIFSSIPLLYSVWHHVIGFIQCGVFCFCFCFGGRGSPLTPSLSYLASSFLPHTLKANMTFILI